MPIGCGRGIYDSGVRLHPRSDHCPAHSTGGNADTRVAAYAFHLPSICQGVDIQDALIFSKPYRGLNCGPIPFETFQIKISLTYKGAEVVMHSAAFMLDAVGMFACHIVLGMRRTSVLHTGEPIYASNTREQPARL